MRVIRITDKNKKELGFIRTNMTDAELKESFKEIYDSDGKFKISCFERFEEYAQKLDGRFCDKFYIDDVMEVEEECQL